MQPTLSRRLASVVHHHHITSLSSASENNELKGLSSGITVRYWKDTVYVALRDVAYTFLFSQTWSSDVLIVQPKSLFQDIAKDKTVTEKHGAWWMATVKYHVVDLKNGLLLRKGLLANWNQTVVTYKIFYNKGWKQTRAVPSFSLLYFGVGYMCWCSVVCLLYSDFMILMIECWMS